MLQTFPQSFPHEIIRPKFTIGDRVRFVPMPAEDFGIVAGLHFAPAEHLQDWTWRYVVWLDDHSPSRQWTCSDLAWEDDLQLLSPPPIDVMAKEQTV